MLLPWSHDTAPLERRPWVTLGLIAACVVTLVVTQLDPAVGHFERAIGEAHTYWSAHPYLEPGGLLADTFGDAGAEARAEFRESLLAGEVPIPRNAVEAEQVELDTLTTTASEALERHVWHRYGLVPAAPRAQGILGHLFLHAGWVHLIGNLLFLLLTGPFLEARWGRLPYLLFYLGAGVAAALLFTFQNPYGMSPLIGASGAIAGTMGAFLVVFATVRIRFAYWLGFFWGTFAVPAWLLLPLWFAHELASARLMDLAGTSDGIAYWAHVGGFAFGALVAGLLRVTGADTALAFEPPAPADAARIEGPVPGPGAAPEGASVDDGAPGGRAAPARSRAEGGGASSKDASWNLWAAVSRADRPRALREWQALLASGLEPAPGTPDATLRLAGWLAADGATHEAGALLTELLPRADRSVAERIAGVAGRIDEGLARLAAERLAALSPGQPAPAGPPRHEAPAAFAVEAGASSAAPDRAPLASGEVSAPPRAAPPEIPEPDALFGLESEEALSDALSGLESEEALSDALSEIESDDPAVPESQGPDDMPPSEQPGAATAGVDESSQLFETDTVDLAAKDDESWTFDDDGVGLDAPGSHAAAADAELFDRDALDLGLEDE